MSNKTGQPHQILTSVFIINARQWIVTSTQTSKHFRPYLYIFVCPSISHFLVCFCSLARIISLIALPSLSHWSHHHRISCVLVIGLLVVRETMRQKYQCCGSFSSYRKEPPISLTFFLPNPAWPQLNNQIVLYLLVWLVNS